MKPSLLVLAAGMGSRYGGLKQLDPLGPGGETIMDYSIYDAVRAGFGKVVFVIRHDFEEDFRNKIISKYSNIIPVEVVFQSIDALPNGFTAPAGRTKPWGTNHAVMMGAQAIDEPFAVINADDFYGSNSFEVICRQLESYSTAPSQCDEYCMVGYHCGNTMSEGGTVSRGECSTNEEGYLTSVVERTALRRIEGVISYTGEEGLLHSISDDTLVSMNLWGFTPNYFRHSEAMFRAFLAKNIENPKAEYFIPAVVNYLINSGKARVKVLQTTSKWFGVTYPQDRPLVVEKFAQLARDGEYPTPLFGTKKV